MSSNYFVSKAVRYIEENYDKDISISSMSGILHISESHLSYLFVKHTGERFCRTVNKIRIEEAKRLLTETDKSISYVSNVCGYKNQSYFSYVFKQYTNLTPLEYRKRDRM